MTDAFPGQRFLVRKNGVLLATPLLAVVLVEVTDIIFAVDSIPAIFAVTDEVFLVFTANAFAILGLSAMYFLLADLIHRLVYLKAGLVIVPIWVGIEMALRIDVYRISTTVFLTMITSVLTVSIIAGLRATRGQKRHEPPSPAVPPFRIADAEEMTTLEPVWRRKHLGARGGRARLDDRYRASHESH